MKGLAEQLNDVGPYIQRGTELLSEIEHPEILIDLHHFNEPDTSVVSSGWFASFRLSSEISTAIAAA